MQRLGMFILALWSVCTLACVTYAESQDTSQLTTSSGSVPRGWAKLIYRNLQRQADELYKAAQYERALAAAERARRFVEASVFADRDKSVPAKANGNVAWYALFARQPERALAASEGALILAPYSLPDQTNRAHALMFLDRIEEARLIYLGHKGETIGLAKWEVVIAQDFLELRAHGLDHPQMRAIEEALTNAADSPHVQSAATVDAMMKQINLLHGQGKYAEALPLAEQALAIRERSLGPEHPDTLSSVNRLALFNHLLGRFSEAEQLYRRAVEGRERVLGSEHSDTLLCIGNLAALYVSRGRYSEGEALYLRTLEASERLRGMEHPDTLGTVNNMAAMYVSLGRYRDAEQFHKRALAAYERVLGKEHRQTLLSVHNLATLYQMQGRYDEAETLYRRAVEVSERMLGKDHPQTLGSVHGLASLYRIQGRESEAEPLYRRTLEARERVLGKEHPDTLLTVNNLAALYRVDGRYSEAEPLYQRAFEARGRVLGKEHPDTLSSANDLAVLFRLEGRDDEAEPLYQRTLEARERVLGKEHPDTLITVDNLAMLYHAYGRHGEAEPLFRRALEASERVLGREHPQTLGSTHNLAAHYSAQGRYNEAEPLYRLALDARERVLGKEHPDTLLTVNNLAALYFVQRDWSRAVQLWRHSTSAIVGRTLRGTQDVGQALTGKKKSGAERSRSQFGGLIKAAIRLSPEGSAPDNALSREMLQAAQWALNSEAAQSLAQMAARSARGDPALAALVRERQDKLAEWQKRNMLRNAALGEAQDKRNAKAGAEAENLRQLAAVEARIAEIDKRLTAEFPDYAGLASPAPLTVEDVQAQLGTDEALVLFLDTPDWQPAVEETFVWVVTKTELRWIRSNLGTAALTREVQALRCGLDADAWDGPHCANIFGGGYTKADAERGRPLPFDYPRAHKLYKALFGQVEDLIKGKHLLIVPSGPLTQLPFQVLVTAMPPAPQSAASKPPKIPERDQASVAAKATAWLIRDHALTVLPAVSSLKALRRVARPSAATKPMIGFGNPLLDGEQNHRDPRYAAYFKKRAQLARDNQQCRTSAFQRVADLFGWHRGIAPVEIRGGLANVEQIRMQAPLPETADELCAVARDLKADAADIHLGEGASEHDVKALSASGQLAQYRIVHFATHGALAGELKDTSEPGLLLTPPDAATEDDDGYLSASEIASLKLDADWVILSACNTAAGDATGAQALSGLARAFIYAQARALLVSHWAVDSNATVKLITGAMRETSRDAKVGRAEALRRSMLVLIDKGEANEAHPAFWAPFVVVGEGGR